MYEKRIKSKKEISKIHLKLVVPAGQLSSVVRIVNYLSSKFSKYTIEITLDVEGGEFRRKSMKILF